MTPRSSGGAQTVDKSANVYRLLAASNEFQALESSEAMERLRMLFHAGEPIGKRWQRFIGRLDEQRLRSRPVGDFPSWAGFPLVASARAWEVLGPLVSAVVEPLPFVVRHDGKDSEYFVLHVLNLVDCLDRRRAVLDWTAAAEGRAPYVFAIDEYAFVRSRVESHSIFRVPEKPDELFCSDTVRRGILDAKLRGLRFVGIPL